MRFEPCCSVQPCLPVICCVEFLGARESGFKLLSSLPGHLLGRQSIGSLKVSVVGRRTEKEFRVPDHLFQDPSFLSVLCRVLGCRVWRSFGIGELWGRFSATPPRRVVLRVNSSTCSRTFGTAKMGCGVAFGLDLWSVCMQAMLAAVATDYPAHEELHIQQNALSGCPV